ncbi:MAG: hypothetical protein KAG99_05065, partial [Bacteroidales bacterium]|nr:hypothetical protein [Bacteroidales bacterium]
MKKYILSLVLMMTLSSIVFSQSAQTIHYQAIVRNATGSVLVNLNVGVRISILHDSIDGITVYSETHNVNTNQFGLIDLSIGAGIVSYGNFSSINWSNSSFVKTEIDDEGGTDYQLTRITRLLSVPYSLHTSGLIVTDANGNSYHVIVDTLGNLTTVPTNPWYCGDPFTDSRDGATYNTIQIGTQCWMAENLNIGTRIDGVNDQINNSIIEKYCYNDIEDSCDVYGGLFQWDEMMQYITDTLAQGICPTGWHIPADYEWKVLEGNVDSQYPVGDPEWDLEGYRGFDAGKNLKSINSWEDNTGTDLYGFT